ncbi:MAG: hypothetical protein O2904_00325 [bacterium]|nr:hypothetical protein [bacterium]
MQLLIGTDNAGKVTELSECLAHLPFDILTPKRLEIELPPPEETGSSYTENAMLKARYYYNATGIPTLADDSGIVIDSLEGELGVHTRRWGAGADATDSEWIEHFLERMSKEENKRARFVCTIAYIDPEGRVHVFEGVNEGVITDKLEAEYLPGLPIAGCFKPDGHDLVYSAMSVDQKNTVSHRGMAMQQFLEHIN